MNGQQILINAVDSYTKNIALGDVPWWAGDHTALNGYYFTPSDSGGTYCNTQGRFGLTSTITPLVQAEPGAQPKPSTKPAQSIIFCPWAFDNTAEFDGFPPQVDSYPIGLAVITTEVASTEDSPFQKGTSLDEVMPRSTTLLHEAFHVVARTELTQVGELCKSSFLRLILVFVGTLLDT